MDESRKPPTPSRAIAYIRVSTEQQAESGLGLHRLNLWPQQRCGQLSRAPPLAHLFEQEPPWGSAILERENAIFTPHVAGFSQVANELSIRMAVDNVINVLTGKAPLDCVNPDVLLVRAGR